MMMDVCPFFFPPTMDYVNPQSGTMTDDFVCLTEVKAKKRLSPFTLLCDWTPRVKGYCDN